MGTKLRAFCLALVLAALPATAMAHGPEGDGELSPIEALSADHQHGGKGGHLPAVQRNVELVGKLDLFTLLERPGRVSDVAGYGNHAYLGAFYEPDCEGGGVYVIDIERPKQPKQAGFIPASPGAYVGEGVQVLDLDTTAFKGQVLIHNNENCVPAAGPLPAGRGGASLWNVSNPEQPEKLSEHVGDEDVLLPALHASTPHASHSAFGWQQGDKAYMVMVDNGELSTGDIDIFDITDPRNPVFVAETGLPDFEEIAESPSPNGNNAFLHDMVVKKVANRYLLLGSYWDGGYIVLDVTDLPSKPKLLRDTDFGPVEPFAAEMGLPADWTPEGNAHQAEFNRNGSLFLGADEDFGPFRVTGEITSDPHTGKRFSATQGSDVPRIDDETTRTGPTKFVGDACTPVAPATPGQQEIALVERGTCTFTIKLQNVQAAGYSAGIVFNDQQGGKGCDAQVSMLAVGDIPFVFVGRTVGLQILKQSPDDACTTDTPKMASPSSDVDLRGVFDGWGYLHLYNAHSMKVLDHWALPESLQPDKAKGHGDLSIHEVAMDPSLNRAYVSHYAGGFRVLDFDGETGIREVGAFIDHGGSNIWGVEVLPPKTAGENPLVLASDRDAGLYIFRYSPGAG